MEGRNSKSIATHEVPQILIQGILAYNQNPTSESYTGFVVSIDKTVLHISMAAMSHAYMENLCQGNSSSECLQFCRSEPYDIAESDRRRELLRLIVGLFRFLIAKLGV